MSAPIIRVAARGEAEQETARILTICNACRYCEGFCAVFPAMTRRLEFARADAHYLANLCHNCGACLHACQYAPPHEFAVNVPRTLARVRAATYAEYAWPSAFGALYRRNGLFVALALAFGLAAFMLLWLALGSPRPPAASADFYAVFPHGLMVGVFAPVFGFAVLALAVGVRRFWRGLPRSAGGGGASGDAQREAAGAALSLRYLDGGHGDGCNDESDRFTLRRRRFHHVTFYGFLACFAATSVATLYHYAGWPAPYPVTSVPVLLGIAGGIGLVVGPAGLWWLHRRRDPLQGDPRQDPMDLGLVTLLLLSGATGLVLLAARSTAAMPALLAIHLGVVLALFVTMPYGKFAHGAYRVAALLRYAIERREPDRLKLGE